MTVESSMIFVVCQMKFKLFKLQSHPFSCKQKQRVNFMIKRLQKISPKELITCKTIGYFQVMIIKLQLQTHLVLIQCSRGGTSSSSDGGTNVLLLVSESKKIFTIYLTNDEVMSYLAANNTHLEPVSSKTDLSIIKKNFSYFKCFST